MEEVTIYADNREAKSKVTAILKHRCNLVMKQLDVGDYLLSKRVAVERKTCDDFINSIVDGRLFKQLTELKNNFDYPILIIEGDNIIDEKRKVHPNAIRGAIAAVAMDFSMPIITTKCALETSEMLLAIAKREQLDNGKSNSIRGKKKAKSMNHHQEFLVCGLPTISTGTARKMLKHFGSPEKIFAATEEELTALGGIGPKKAKIIRKILSKKYEKSILED